MVTAILILALIVVAALGITAFVYLTTSGSILDWIIAAQLWEAVGSIIGAILSAIAERN
jgi:hypothetical protein